MGAKYVAPKEVGVPQTTRDAEDKAQHQRGAYRTCLSQEDTNRAVEAHLESVRKSEENIATMANYFGAGYSRDVAAETK